MTMKDDKQTSAAAAVKAQRERDMAQAMQDYENEQRARLANMERLRALRLAKERTEPKPVAAPQPVKRARSS